MGMETTHHEKETIEMCMLCFLLSFGWVSVWRIGAGKHVQNKLKPWADST